jgi:hypothetical protein
VIDHDPLPDRLRKVLKGAKPVQPLHKPWKRVLFLLPLAMATVLAVPWYFGIRPDHQILDPMSMVGLSLLQFVAGAWLLAGAMQDAVPGNALSRRTLMVLAAMPWAVFLFVTLATATRSATTVPAGAGVRYLRICLGTPVLIGLPLLLCVQILAFRAFPLRPVMVGFLGGIGAGLIGDSGWRLYCGVTDPWRHVLPTHGGALAALGLIGALTGRIWPWVLNRGGLPRPEDSAPIRR